MNVFVVERRQHELLMSLPHCLAVEREDLALQALSDAFLNEKIHR